MIIPRVEEKPKLTQVGLFLNKISYSPKELLLKINVADFRPNAHQPANCYNCGSKFIVPLEVIDIHDKPLFWSCMKCGFKSLKEDFEYIAKLIEESRDTYVIPEHFSDIKSIKA